MHQEYQAPAALKDVIACFWHTRKGTGDRKSTFEVQPDGYAEIIFYFGSTCSILQEGTFQKLPSPFLMGLLNKPAVFSTEMELDILGVRCYPWAVFDLLRLPAGPAEVLVFEHPIAQLHAVLNTDMQQGRVEEAIFKLQQYFLDAHLERPDRLLSKAGGVLRERKGDIPVNQLAASADATVRTLERKFKHSAGHTVKDVSALMRFEQVRNELWNNPGVNLASLAHELGYTDQAHLSRAFKRYSGSSPRAFARKALVNRRVLDFVAFVQA